MFMDKFLITFWDNCHEILSIKLTIFSSTEQYGDKTQIILIPSIRGGMDCMIDLKQLDSVINYLSRYSFRLLYFILVLFILFYYILFMLFYLFLIYNIIYYFRFSWKRNVINVSFFSKLETTGYFYVKIGFVLFWVFDFKYKKLIKIFNMQVLFFRRYTLVGWQICIFILLYYYVILFFSWNVYILSFLNIVYLFLRKN